MSEIASAILSIGYRRVSGLQIAFTFYVDCAAVRSDIAVTVWHGTNEPVVREDGVLAVALHGNRQAKGLWIPEAADFGDWRKTAPGGVEVAWCPPHGYVLPESVKDGVAYVNSREATLVMVSLGNVTERDLNISLRAE